MAVDKKGTDGDDRLRGGDGRDTLDGGSGDDTFIQNFNDVGNNTIADFNPDEDTIDFQGIDSDTELSITQTEDGGTFIDAGNGSTLTISGVTPDQLSARNVEVNGEAVSGDNFNLQSALGGAADVGLDVLSGALGGDEASTDIADLGGGGDNPLDIALGGALDNNTQQGGAPAASGAAGAGGGAAGLDIASDEVETEEADEAQVDEVAVG